ncbi:MAG: carbohydrate-binding protein, partial [Fibrobacter sp.]|nr:carbohydrate-binding protein [Fibrobacter sp.]
QGLPYYNPHFNYFVEEVVMPSNGNKTGSNIEKYEKAVGDVVSVDKYAQTGWCDNSSTDKNDCIESKNHVVEEIRDVRNDCEELFKIPESSIAYSSSFTPPSSASVNPTSSSSVISSSGSTSYETVRYEAEDATCVGSGCETKSHKDASGGKYVLTKNDGNITFNINVPSAGTYTVTIRYNNSANNAKTQDIYVNGTKVKSQEFPVTLGGNVGGANAAFEDMPVQVSLKAGDNTFAINKSWGYVDIDYIAIDVPVSSETTIQTVRYEAEDANCTGCTEKTNQAASGGKYMRTETTGDITFNINVPTAGTYKVTIRFSNTAANAKTQDIYVNETKVKSQEFPVTLEGNLGGAAAAFEDMPVQVSLKAGANTFAIIKNWGHVDIDYIEVAVPNQSGPSSSASVTSSASAPTSSSSASSPVSNSSVQPASSASATAIPSIAANVPLFRAYAAGKSIHLEGVQPGQAFAVLDMQGRVLHSGKVSTASGMTLQVDRPGVYLVKVGSSVRTVKAY